MNCRCDLPAVPVACRGGQPSYRCSLGRCKLFANFPVSVDGYRRPRVPVGSTQDDTIFLQAVLVKPSQRLRASSQRSASAKEDLAEGEDQQPFQQGLHILAATLSERASLQETMESPDLQGIRTSGYWPNPVRQYLYPFAQYDPLKAALQAWRVRTPNLVGHEVCDIPSFFWKVHRGIGSGYETSSSSDCFDLPEDDIVFRNLKPFQRDGVRFVLRHEGRAMIADEMGLGKTIQGIATAHYYRLEWPLLVLCPVSLMENWAKEISQWCGIPRGRISLLQGKKSRANLASDAVVIVAYSSLASVLEDPPYKVVILDESHFIKTPDSQRTAAALKLCTRAKRVLLLSGTPAMSRPFELYTQLYALHPDLFPTKYQFAARYCNAYVSKFGNDNTGHSFTPELNAMLEHFLIRRVKSEVLGELPCKSRQLLYVCVTEKEKKLMESQLAQLRKSIGPEANGGKDGLSSATRGPNAFELKIATARAKIPAVQDYLKDLLEGSVVPQNEKVIVFAHHQVMMDAIRTAVESINPRKPLDYIYISGETPVADREQLATHFRTCETCHVAILSMQSSGTGHNFTCASTVIFAELDWNPSTHLQCEDRVHRMGQTSDCTIRYLLADGTADAVIWPMLQEKMSVTNSVLDAHHQQQQPQPQQRAMSTEPSKENDGLSMSTGKKSSLSSSYGGVALAPSATLAANSVRTEVKRNDVVPEKKAPTLRDYFKSSQPTPPRSLTAPSPLGGTPTLASDDHGSDGPTGHVPSSSTTTSSTRLKVDVDDEDVVVIVPPSAASSSSSSPRTPLSASLKKQSTLTMAGALSSSTANSHSGTIAPMSSVVAIRTKTLFDWKSGGSQLNPPTATVVEPIPATGNTSFHDGPDVIVAVGPQRACVSRTARTPAEDGNAQSPVITMPSTGGALPGDPSVVLQSRNGPRESQASLPSSVPCDESVPCDAARASPTVVLPPAAALVGPSARRTMFQFVDSAAAVSSSVPSAPSQQSSSTHHHSNTASLRLAESDEHVQRHHIALEDAAATSRLGSSAMRPPSESPPLAMISQQRGPTKTLFALNALPSAPPEGGGASSTHKLLLPPTPPAMSVKMMDDDPQREKPTTTSRKRSREGSSSALIVDVDEVELL